MAFREVRVFEVREILRLWLRGKGLPAIAGWRGWTARRSAATKALLKSSAPTGLVMTMS